METQLPGLYEQREIKTTAPVQLPMYKARIRQVQEFGQTYRVRNEVTDKLTEMYKGAGFWEYEIPEEAPAELIDEKIGIERNNKEKLSLNERIKARREYTKKREKTIKRIKVLQDYAEKRDQEENEIDIQDEDKDTIRDECIASGLFDTKEERERFLFAARDNEKEQYRKSIDELFKKLSTVDLKMFEVKSEDDLYKNYDVKIRYIKAGYVMKNLLTKYIEFGGVMDDAEYLERLALITFYERQQNLYSFSSQILLHPQNMLMRDEDMKNMTYDEIENRIAGVQERLNAIPAEQGSSPTAMRLKNLKSYLELRKSKAILEMSGAIARINGNPADELKAAQEERREFGYKQWTTNIKSIMKTNELFNSLKTKVYKDGLSGLPKGIWTRAGLDSRVGTRLDVIKLVYMNRYNKTAEDLLRIANPKTKQDQEDLKNFIDVAEKIERKLNSQKPLPMKEIKDQNGKVIRNVVDNNYDAQEYKDDIIVMASIVEEMIRGAFKQFKVVGGKATYMQCYGLPKTMNEKVLNIPSEKWGRTAAITLELSEMIKDISQMLEADENVSRVALSKFTAEELALFNKMCYFAENASQGIQTLPKTAQRLGLMKSDDITLENMMPLLKDTSQPMTLGIVTQVVSYFLRGFAPDDKVMTRRASNMTEQTVNGKKVAVPSPEEWELPLGIGNFRTCIEKLYGKDDIKEIEGVFTTQEAQELSRTMLGEATNSPDAVSCKSFTIPYETDRTVRAPEGF